MGAVAGRRSWEKLRRLQRHNIVMRLEASSTTLFTKQMGWMKEEVEVFVGEVREDLDGLGEHFLWSSVSQPRHSLKARNLSNQDRYVSTT